MAQFQFHFVKKVEIVNETTLVNTRKHNEQRTGYPATNYAL